MAKYIALRNALDTQYVTINTSILGIYDDYKTAIKETTKLAEEIKDYCENETFSECTKINTIIGSRVTEITFTDLRSNIRNIFNVMTYDK